MKCKLEVIQKKLVFVISSTTFFCVCVLLQSPNEQGMQCFKNETTFKKFKKYFLISVKNNIWINVILLKLIYIYIWGFLKQIFYKSWPGNVKLCPARRQIHNSIFAFNRKFLKRKMILVSNQEQPYTGKSR